MSKPIGLSRQTASDLKELVRRMDDGLSFGESANVGVFTSQPMAMVFVEAWAGTPGLYLGAVKLLDAAALSWGTSEGACYIFEAGRRTLAIGQPYLGLRYGDLSGTPVFAVSNCCGSSSSSSRSSTSSTSSTTSSRSSTTSSRSSTSSTSRSSTSSGSYGGSDCCDPSIVFRVVVPSGTAAGTYDLTWVQTCGWDSPGSAVTLRLSLNPMTDCFIFIATGNPIFPASYRTSSPLNCYGCNTFNFNDAPGGWSGPSVLYVGPASLACGFGFAAVEPEEVPRRMALYSTAGDGAIMRDGTARLQDGTEVRLSIAGGEWRYRLGEEEGTCEVLDRGGGKLIILQFVARGVTYSALQD